MRSNFAALALLLFVATGSALAESGIQWASSLDEAQKLAKQSNRLLLLHFGATWCKPCQAVERNVFPQPQVAELVNANFIAVKIDADAMPQVAGHFRVTRLPTDIIATHTGQVVHRTGSPADPIAYLAMLNQALATWSAQQPEAGTMLAARPGAASPSAGRIPPQYAPHTGAQAPNLGGPQSEFSPVAYETGAPQGGYTPQPYAAPGYNAPPYGGAGYDPRAATPPAAAPAFAPQPNPAYAATQPTPSAPQQVTNPYTQGYGAPPAAATAYNGAPPYASAPSAAPPYAGPPAAAPAYGPVAPQPVNVATQPWPAGPQGAPTAAPTGAPGYGAPPAAAPSFEVAQRPQAPTQPAAAPSQPAAPPAPAAAPQIPAGNPPVGLDGFCPVTLAKENRWIRGNAKWGAIHRGSTYLFTSEANQKEFLGNPDVYSPLLGGFDAVKYAEQGIYVQGARKHGAFFNRQVFLFSDEDALARFWAAPQRYATIVRQAMANEAAGGTIQR